MMKMREKEIKQTSLILLVVLLFIFSFEPLVGWHMTQVIATPLENPFKETQATSDPSDAGNNQVVPTTTIPVQTGYPSTDEDVGETVTHNTHKMTGETLPDWKLIPYNDPEFKARSTDGSASHGAVEAIEQKSNILSYRGGEMALKYHLSGVGVGRSQGFLIFIDGIPQPYAIDREKPLPGDDEYRFLHTVDIEEGKGIAEFTLRFLPVTGQKGDMLDLLVGAVLHAGFVPKNPMQFAFAPYYRIAAADYILDFHATPELIEQSDTAQNDSANNRILAAVEFSNEEMSSEELAFATSKTLADEDTDTRWELLLNDSDTSGEPHINLDQHERLDFTFKLRSAPGTRWNVVLYLDHEPLALGDEHYFTLDVVRGQKSVLNFSLDPSLIDGVHTFYMVAMPVREINAQGERKGGPFEVQTKPWTFYRAGEWLDWEPETN
ncbi:MAG TPA: hypothetical protein GXZ89_04040 [Fastidiosipila sp.]|nr:hypothetical protein [Fastidiosipila sp.]